jgi:hypothetical protein
MALAEGVSQMRYAHFGPIAFLIPAVTSCAPDTQLEESIESDQTAAPWKVLPIDYQVQETGYFCGPAATRFAISARKSAPSQNQLARELGTTSNGTDWIGQVTAVLNKHLGGYETREMPNDPPTQAQKDQLWQTIVRNIDSGHAIVANIVAPPSNHPPGYPNETIYHYFALIGYNPETSQVYVADSANFGGNKQYWLSFDQVATLIPPKGYSAWFPRGTTCAGGAGTVIGEIETKYLALGGCNGDLGRPITEEMMTPDGGGRYSVFEHASIYWKPRLGAFFVRGAIRDKWRDLGWERGLAGYPVSDEIPSNDGRGAHSDFERASIYATPETGPHEVHGDIRAKWKADGAEAGRLGYPKSDEYSVPGGRRSDFENGSMIWDAATRKIRIE